MKLIIDTIKRGKYHYKIMNKRVLCTQKGNKWLYQKIISSANVWGSIKKNKDDDNSNETDYIHDTMHKGKWTCPDITPPSVMEECGNMKHNDNNYNETDPGLDTM